MMLLGINLFLYAIAHLLEPEPAFWQVSIYAIASEIAVEVVLITTIVKVFV